jgi:hypothetical protein
MQTLGKLCGGVGLLVLLTAPVTLLVTSGSTTYTVVKAIVGAVLIGIYLATNYKRMLNSDVGGAGRSRASFFFLSSFLITAVAIGGLAAANFIVAKRNKTWDLTNKKIYSLAPQTLTTLQGLKEPVKAIGFLPAKHPYYDALSEIFQRYATETDKFKYEIKDPKKSPDLAAKYQLKEGQTTVVLVRGEGMTESHTVLNVVSEQEVTNALIKLNTVGEQKIYYLVGHGEWPLEETQPSSPDQQSVTSASEFRSSLLQEGYTPELLNLAEKQNQIPRDAALVMIAGPKTPVSEGEKAALKKYLEEGGRLLYFADSNGEGGLDALLAEYGVQVDRGLVADDKLNPMNPFVVVSAFFSDHEITRVLKQVKLNLEFPMTRGLSIVNEGVAQGVTPMPIVLTSPYAWVETTPSENPKPDQGEKTGQIPLVIASTRNTSSAEGKRFDEARVLVFGDANLVVDALWGHEANRNLILNSLAWASTQVSKITIRPPDRDISTIDVDNDMLSKIRFIAMDLLPISLIGVGLAIWLTRRSK